MGLAPDLGNNWSPRVDYYLLSNMFEFSYYFLNRAENYSESEANQLRMQPRFIGLDYPQTG